MLSVAALKSILKPKTSTGEPCRLLMRSCAAAARPGAWRCSCATSLAPSGTTSRTKPARARMMTRNITPIAAARGSPNPIRRTTPGWIRKAMAAPRTNVAQSAQYDDEERHQSRFTAALSDLAANLGFFVGGTVDRVHGAAPSSECVQGQQHESNAQNAISRVWTVLRCDQAACSKACEASGLHETEPCGHYAAAVRCVGGLHQSSLSRHRVNRITN